MMRVTAAGLRNTMLASTRSGSGRLPIGSMSEQSAPISRASGNWTNKRLGSFVPSPISVMATPVLTEPQPMTAATVSVSVSVSALCSSRVLSALVALIEARRFGLVLSSTSWVIWTIERSASVRRVLARGMAVLSKVIATSSRQLWMTWRVVSSVYRVHHGKNYPVWMGWGVHTRDNNSHLQKCYRGLLLLPIYPLLLLPTHTKSVTYLPTPPYALFMPRIKNPYKSST